MALKVKQTEELNELIEAIGQLPNFPFLLELMLDRISRKMGVESAGVMLYDTASNRLELQTPAFGTRDTGKIEKYSVALEDGGNAVTVFQTGKPYFSNDATNDNRYIRKYIDLFDLKSGMTVPLVVSGARIGVLHLNNKKNGEFTDADLELALTYASELAVLIEQSRSFMEMKEREKESRALYEIGLQISNGDRIQDILQSIITALEHCLTMDEEIGVGYCLLQEKMPIGKLFMLRQLWNVPILIDYSCDNFVQKVPVCIHISESIFHPKLQSLAQKHEFKYTLVAPIVTMNNISGFLLILTKKNMNFSGTKLAAIQRFAQQASHALQNYYLTTHKEELIKELKQVNNRLVQSLQIYSKLVQLVLDGGGFDDLAIGIQELVGRKIFLFDEEFKLLSTVNTISGNFQYLIDKQIKKDLPFIGTKTYRMNETIIQITPSNDGTNIVGFVAMEEHLSKNTNPHLNELDRVVLEQSAIVLALRKMQRNMEMEIEGRMILNWLDDVLVGDMPEEVLLRRGKALGYDPKRFNSMFLIEVCPCIDEVGAGKMYAESNKIYNKLRQQMLNDYSNNFVTTHGNVIAILLSNNRNDLAKMVKKLFHDIKKAFPAQIRSAVIMEFDGSFDELRQSYKDGEKILMMLRSIKKSGLFFGSDFSGYLFFLRSHNYEYLQQFLTKKLAPLLVLDEQDKNMWLETLSVYLETSCKIKQTAAVLHIHRNTLIYRIKKLEELLQTDLKDSSKRFDLQLACRLYNMFEGLKKYS